MNNRLKMADKIYLRGQPSPKQKEFFDAREKYIAYGGARGGGKSWALRRKLVLMALSYPGIRMLLIRRTLPELRENHIIPLRAELGSLISYKENEKSATFKNGSRLVLGYMDCERDTLRYQGQEYDIIALDEATQLSEYQFTVLKACLRGANSYPKRMYLTCNPGGVGHSWVKRLFIDKIYHEGENPCDFRFIPARVYDNAVLMESDPDYVQALKSLPSKLRKAWLDGSWDVFEGQYFPEFSEDIHICQPFLPDGSYRKFAALDYGFDMLAILWFAIDSKGRIFVYREYCRSGLTLSEAAGAFVRENRGDLVEYIAASPDLWNRRQDSGRSGVSVMASNPDLPPLIKADDRRIIGWRCLREQLRVSGGRSNLQISRDCENLISSLPALMHDKNRAEDVSSQPHEITHSPEALRYGVMSYIESSDRDANDTSLAHIAQHFTGRRGKSLAEY